MATFLFDKIVFGPVKSRRLGVSLGINLLPDDTKFCNYNCVYCECGWSSNTEKKILPKATDVKAALQSYLQKAGKENIILDVITFAGNGEPTLHPEFIQIINDTIELRDKFFPQIKIAVLTNATRLDKPGISEALNMIEMPILKIDTLIQEDYEFVNGPSGNLKIKKIVDLISQRFEAPIIQTMFFSVKTNDRNFDNTSEESITLYLDALQQLKPSEVMIYSVSRDTPMSGIVKCDLDTLNKIAARIESMGIKTLVTP